jgi:hypothetical protein
VNWLSKAISAALKLVKPIVTAIMAKVEDMDSMLPLFSPAPPSGNIGPVVRVAGLVVFVLALRATLQNTTKCDKPILAWVEWVIDLAMLAIIREVVVLLRGKGRVVKGATAVVVSVTACLWIYGHFPVYLSDRCDMEVWYLAFLVLIWLDITALFLCLALFLLPLVVRNFSSANLSIP